MTKRRTVEFKADTRNLFFHILTKCNLRCKHCYINPSQHGTETLSKEVLDAWLKLFVKEGDQAGRTNVIFLGGEPTLSPNLAHGIKSARELGYGSVTVDTNGYLFHNILDEVTPDDVDFFSFSLDGPSPEVNDPIRGKGVFDTCTSGIKRAKDKGFSTSLIYTVSRMNMKFLTDMPELIRKLGVDKFFIQVIGIRGNSAACPQGLSLQLTRDEWKEIVPPVAHEVAGYGIPVVYPKVFLERDESFQCAALVADNYFVFPNGRVYRCPLCEDFPIHSMEISGDILVKRPPITESDLFHLEIPEGCVLNKILQPGNIDYDIDGHPVHKIACCMLKEEIVPFTEDKTDSYA